ncbi:hypothetical protein D5086_015359 [Populus alba]|uniref:Uncharacterized protein n=1 Tax=Populus alba TaxID=43335 RepID=A0ACC4C2Y1_POPAL
METATQEKAESAIPVTTLSPPESNTTFLGGTTWCVALSGVSQIDLQNALDWTCGLGMADCSHGKCSYAAPGSAAKSPAPSSLKERRANFIWLKFAGIFLLLYLRR